MTGVMTLQQFHNGEIIVVLQTAEYIGVSWDAYLPTPTHSGSSPLILFVIACMEFGY